MALGDGRPMRRAAERQKRRSLVCYLCGKPIDPALRAPDPMSFALEHIVPRSRGGSLYDPANHASSHRACNRAKSDGPVPVRTLTSRQW